MKPKVNFSTDREDSRLLAVGTIICPLRSDKVKISKEVCAKRHLHSRKGIYFERLLGNNPFVDGLSSCRKCSIGKRILKQEIGDCTYGTG